MKTWTIALLLIGAGCNSDSGKPAGPKEKSATDPAVAKFLLASAPTGKVREVKDVRDNAKDGEDVLVSGRVRDFVEDRATFVLIDNSLKACNDIPGDKCKTPWDYCCVPPQTQTAHKFAVKLTDASGQVIKVPLKGTLAYLDKVIVSGKVQRSADGNITVAAVGIHSAGGGVE